MSYRISLLEEDRSNFTTSVSNQIVGIVLKAKKGKNTPFKVTKESEVLLHCGNPDSSNSGVFEAISYVRQSPLWLVTAYGTGALQAGIDVKETSVVAFGARSGRDSDTHDYTTTDLNTPSHGIGTGDGVNDTFAGSVTNTPVKEGSTILKVGGIDQGITDAGEVLSGSALDSGSMAYATGAYTLDFAGTAGTLASLTSDVDLSSGIDLETGSTAGTATVSSVSVGFVGTTVPAIVSATYDLDIAADGGANALAIALLVTDNWNGIAAKIQTALRTATSGTETVIITSGKIKVTSDTVGTSSTIVITAGTVGSGGGDLLVYIDTNIASMTTIIDTPVDGTWDDKFVGITIDNVSVDVDFGHSSSISQATVNSTINAAFSGTPASVNGNFIDFDGIIGDATSGQITLADPSSGTSGLTLLFSTGGTTLTSTDDGTPSTDPTGSIPKFGKAVTFDYLYTLDLSTTVSHSFYALSPYDDADYQMAAKIEYVTGSQYKMTLYNVLSTGNEEINVYNYSLIKEKDGYGASLYIDDVFKDNDHVIAILNSDYTGTIANPTIATISFTGGERGTNPQTSDFTAAWNQFQSANKYRCKTFLDVYGGYGSALQTLINTYQTQATGITVVPMGNDASAADTYRTATGIDFDKIAIYTNWAKIKDTYNNSYAWVSQIGKVGVKWGQMDDVYDGLPPAGIDENKHGGVLSGFQVVEMEYDYDDADLQILDEAQINPIIMDDAGRIIIDGDRTMQIVNSDTSFIHTRRNYSLIMDNVARQILIPQKFKLNDATHRLKAWTLTTKYINPMVGVTLREAQVVCDERNNTDEILDQRKFVLDIFVKTLTSTEFITLRLTRVSQTQVIAEILPVAA